MSIFTSKHYRAISGLFAECRNSPSFDHVEVEAMAREFAQYFGFDNPNFKFERFLKACGMEEPHAPNR